jgi:pullulanase
MSSAVPLIAMGQEIAEDYWIPEDDHGTGRRVRPRPLRWANLRDSYGSKTFALYRRLIALRNDYPALRSTNFYPAEWLSRERDAHGFGVDVTRGIVVFHRWGEGPNGGLARFIVALNFSAQDHRTTLSFPENGRWRDVLADREVTVADFRLEANLEPDWGHIYLLA